VYYRYDPNNIKCEVFDYARRRASIFYKYHKARYCGEKCDLEQIAMMAIIEVAADIEDKTKIPESLMISAVDKALTESIKSDIKESPVGEDSENDEEWSNYNNSILDIDKYPLTARSTIKLREFHEFLSTILTPDRVDIVWKILVLGHTYEEKVAEWNRDNKDTKKFQPATVGTIKRLLAESVATIRMNTPEDVINEIAKLKVERE
jgi:hypothetical protein